MAELKQNLYINNTKCKIYTTAVETNNQYINVDINDIKGYIAIDEISHDQASDGRIEKNNKIYSILTQNEVPYTKLIYDEPGTFTLTVPSGVTKVKLTLAGGGGGGGNNIYYTYYSYHCKASSYHKVTVYGGSGGRGGLFLGTVKVVPNKTYKITVGAGGSAVRAGGSSKFGSLAQATGGGAGSSAYKSSGDYHQGSNGSSGSPYGSGGAGGSNGGGSGQNGWVYVEFGKGIE